MNIFQTYKKHFRKWVKKDNNLYFLLGAFFLIMQFFIFFGNYRTDRYDVFFWFCNHTPLFFAIAFFLRKDDFIKGLINVGFLAQFVWTLDFLSRILLGVHIFNITEYIFEDPNGLWVLLPIGIHIFSTNLALYFTYKKKPKTYALFYSMIYVLFLYSTTLTFTVVQNNINWVFKPEGLNMLIPYYTGLWPFIAFLLLVIPTHAIQYGLYQLSKRKAANRLLKNQTTINSKTPQK